MMKPRLTMVILVAVALSSAIALPAQESGELYSQSVGKAGYIKEIILPGSELIAKPLEQESEMVVRIIQAIPHGDSFRYEIQFHGLEPGSHDLGDWLERKDGSGSNLPEIPIEILSLLPPGQVEPNALETGWLPRLGGYRNVLIGASVLWGLVFLFLLFGGRKKDEIPEETEPQESLADLLKTRLDAVQNDEMPKEQYAELERMLLAFWRRRLGLESADTAEALRTIHENPEAGPLMKQLEQWIHNPESDKHTNLSVLLEPLRSIPANEAETVS
ncbi:MAG: hypothetical protein P8J33_17880 [Pirellulaceae bacterium]|nr:hypothetical protein [Pirellulaceae bacterium]